MAKISVIEREKKRQKIVAKYAAKRAALKQIIGDRSASDAERWQAQQQLQKLPRNASPVRLRNRCGQTGATARCLPQVRTGPEQAARSGQPGRHPRPRQGELVARRPR